MTFAIVGGGGKFGTFVSCYFGPFVNNLLDHLLVCLFVIFG